ncbi:MAG: diacylglycerol kinase family lipid kinase [Cytophagales bacterium]|nr:diacylglycerol kinase family lipid kinase [Cytophagales bacterium]MCA6386483.1 diacylglycerol kinase family lipid kinase [Cytophagales bacterium]MCA6390007.1 diacylglycerol kinase family lipid kinase [Cytophagales bacterium]MCA6395140.1 diacylglycerol kinase family lipid kinase [Cytophagales bacterium]MCA6398167.1 diacylglycerol kinase family lipid kinase [Cytophagales bacterium]
MKILIILNGISRKKNFFYREILPALQENFEITLAETAYASHATRLASEAPSQGFDCVLSAGGDGTLHQVINGILLNGNSDALPSIGVIPLGSGNDFATACEIETNATSIIKLLKENSPKPTDVGKILCEDSHGNKIQKYFINVCSLGMGPATVQQMEKSPKWMSADLRYFTAIVQTFFNHQPEKISLKTENWEFSGKVRVFAVANGKSFGNKIFIAPDAKMEDGWLNTFLASDLPLAKFLWYLQTIKQKKKITDSRIEYTKVKEVSLSSPQKLLLEAEGELVGQLPAQIEIIENRIKFFR